MTTLTITEKKQLLSTPKGLVKAEHVYGKYKTAILGDLPYTFKAVTRVNHHTAQLWLNWRNALVIESEQPFVKTRKYLSENGEERSYPILPDKVNWLVLIGNYRREQDDLISRMITN